MPYNINLPQTFRPVQNDLADVLLGEILPADITSSGFVMIPAGTKITLYYIRRMAAHLHFLGSPEMKLEQLFEELRDKHC